MLTCTIGEFQYGFQDGFNLKIGGKKTEVQAHEAGLLDLSARKNCRAHLL